MYLRPVLKEEYWGEHFCFTIRHPSPGEEEQLIHSRSLVFTGTISLAGAIDVTLKPEASLEVPL